MEDALNAAFSLQNEKAIVIQHRWREYIARKRAKSEEEVVVDDPEEAEVAGEQLRIRALLERYAMLVDTQKELFRRNGMYQHMLHVRIDDVKDVTRRTDPDHSTEAEPRYSGLLARLVHKRISHEQLVEERSTHSSDIEARIAHLRAQATATVQQTLALRRAALIGPQAAGATGRKRGAAHATLDANDESDIARLEQLSDARVHYMRLRHRQRAFEKAQRERDRSAVGLHLIDFEQLKIENQSWNEKIEERNEDILKIRKKATATIHILTHIKEKLVFTLAENAALREHLDAVDAQLVHARDALSKRKRERDALASENAKMRERTPLVGAHDLLLDYEQRKAVVVALRDEVARLRAHHHALAQHIASFQRLFGAAAAAAAASMPTLGVRA